MTELNIEKIRSLTDQHENELAYKLLCKFLFCLYSGDYALLVKDEFLM